MMRVIAALGALLALGQSASAGEKAPLLHRVSCVVVRYYVAKYSEAAAESWARGQGASEQEIEAARHCLIGATPTVQAANIVK